MGRMIDIRMERTDVAEALPARYLILDSPSDGGRSYDVFLTDRRSLATDCAVARGLYSPSAAFEAILTRERRKRGTEAHGGAP